MRKRQKKTVQHEKKGTGRFGCHRASVTDAIMVGICILAMTIIMMAYMGSMQLLDSKAQISQVARKYILRMETVGYLTGNDRMLLSQELHQLGVSELDLTGSTMSQVDYGAPILLVIRGKISGQDILTEGGLFHTVFGTAEYEFEERRMSTAKN